MSTKAEQGELTCHDLVRCLFNLNQTELGILEILPEGEALTAQQVGKLLGVDRSTAYRGLEKLVSLRLVFKERRTGKSRGYTNVYQRVSERELYRKAEENLDTCYARIKAMLDQEMAQHRKPTKAETKS
jgi:predicted transcriptional regulator